jgi:hypothetical protein
VDSTIWTLWDSGSASEWRCHFRSLISTTTGLKLPIYRDEQNHGTRFYGMMTWSRVFRTSQWSEFQFLPNWWKIASNALIHLGSPKSFYWTPKENEGRTKFPICNVPGSPNDMSAIVNRLKHAACRIHLSISHGVCTVEEWDIHTNMHTRLQKGLQC